MSPALFRQGVPLVLCAALLGGCGKGVYLDDDEGAPRPARALFGDQPNHLSLPYALGTQVRITAVNTDGDPAGWQLRSAAPAVLRVDKVAVEDKRLVADCTAAGEGEARLSLLDAGGAERKVATVTVKAPDRARAFAHGPLRVLGIDAASFDAAEVREARVLSGGQGVFAIGYFRGEQRLYGRGIAAAQAPAQVAVENRTAPGFAASEWLFLSPSAPGTYELKLAPGGLSVLTLPVVAVAEADLASLALAAEQPRDPQPDQTVWVAGLARDREGRDVYGVYLDWTLDGAVQLGQNGNAAEQQGDLYRYSYAPTATQQLVASRGALRAALAIPASKGYVARTTYLGCSAAPGAGPGPAAALALAPALVVLLRRRARPRP